MSVLRQGRIVYVPMLDPQGRNPKSRPAVIVTPTDQIRPDGLVQVVGITTQLGRAPAEVTVPLPWHRDGQTRTKLRRPSEAICSWPDSFPAGQLTDTGGYVAGDPLVAILQIVKQLEAAANPPAVEPPAPPPPPTE